MTPPEYFGEVRPVRPELELHRDAGDYADGEVQSKDLRPETRRGSVALVTGPERAPFPVDEEPGQSHRQLGKEIVVGDREGELKPVPQSGIVHHDFAAPAGPNGRRTCDLLKSEIGFPHGAGVNSAEDLRKHGHQRRPSGLVAGAEAGAVVAVEVLVERNVVAPVRVLLELLRAAEHRPPAALVAQEDALQTSRDLLAPPRRASSSCPSRSGHSTRNESP